MAKRKAEEKKEEEQVEVDLEEQKTETEEERDEKQGLKVTRGTDIEVEENETEEEELEEQKIEKPSPDASTQAILEGFNMLRQTLQEKGESTANLPKPESGESEEDFAQRVNEEIFKDNPYGTLKKAINREARKIVETEVGPLLGSIMESAFENAEFRLKNDSEDGPIYRKYESEVKSTLKTLTPAQQKNPQVLKAVFERVKSLHINEIIDMKLEEKLKSQKKTETPPPVRKPAVGEGGSTVMPGSSSGKRVMIPKSELESIKRRAAQLGIDYRELVARR